MSISLNVVRCAVACCDSSRCSAIFFRRVVIFSRVSRSPEEGGGVGGREGARGGVGALAAGGVAAFAEPFSITSALLTTPPRPLPWIAGGSTPRAAASFAAAGEKRASPKVRAGGGEGDGCLFAPAQPIGTCAKAATDGTPPA